MLVDSKTPRVYMIDDFRYNKKQHNMEYSHFHPIFHFFTRLSGAKIDRRPDVLPTVLDDEDECETALLALSEPPRLFQRISQVSINAGSKTIHGKNFPDMMCRCYQIIFKQFVDLYRQRSVGYRGKPPAPLTVMFSPEDMDAFIELDAATQNNNFNQYLKAVESAAISPVMTVPFDLLMPTLNNFDKRVAIRAGLEIYVPLIKKYNASIPVGSSPQGPFIIPVHLPRFAIDNNTLAILWDETRRFANANDISAPQLLLLLDSMQLAEPRTIDRKKDLVPICVPDAPGAPVVALTFDMKHSQWISLNIFAAKKTVDRIIAKKDMQLEEKGFKYCWLQIERLDNLFLVHRSQTDLRECINMLFQMGDIPIAADIFALQKLMCPPKFASRNMPASLMPRTAFNVDAPQKQTLDRWLGFKAGDAQPTCIPPRLTTRFFGNKTAEEKVPQCWKIAWNATRERVIAHIAGDVRTLTGGFIGAIADAIGPQATIDARRAAVLDFLGKYSRIYFREIFVQQEMSAADARVRRLFTACLPPDAPEPSFDALISAAVAARGYYFLMASRRALATERDTMDQPDMYEAVMFLMLAVNDAAYLCVLRGDTAARDALFDLVRTELFDFETAYDRCNLATYGVTREDWALSIVSQLKDNKLNIVARVARYLAASQLQKHGFVFTADDPECDTDRLTGTSCGHIRAPEMQSIKIKWENRDFCGFTEE